MRFQVRSRDCSWHDRQLFCSDHLCWHEVLGLGHIISEIGKKFTVPGTFTEAARLSGYHTPVGGVSLSISANTSHLQLDGSEVSVYWRIVFIASKVTVFLWFNFESSHSCLDYSSRAWILSWIELHQASFGTSPHKAMSSQRMHTTS